MGEWVWCHDEEAVIDVDDHQSNDGGGPASQGVEGGEGVEASQGTSRPSLIQGSDSDGYDDIDGDDVASELRESCSETEQQEELGEPATSAYVDRAIGTWTEILKSLFGKWSFPQQNAVANHIFLQPQTVGTLCSGSELTMALLQEAPGIWGGDEKMESTNLFEHVFSCENAGFKQRWIMDHFPPQMLFADAGEVGKGEGTDLMSSEVREVPYVDCFFAGFSCKDVSAMNIWKCLWEQRQACLDGTTAYTLACGLQCIDAKRPKIFVLENVPAFAVRGGVRLCYVALQNDCGTFSSCVIAVDEDDIKFGALKLPLTVAFLETIQNLESGGYTVIPMLIDPRSYYVPQRRLRLYLAGVHNDSCGITNTSAFRSRSLQTATQMLADAKSEPVSLDRMLLDEDSPDFKYWDRCVIDSFILSFCLSFFLSV